MKATCPVCGYYGAIEGFLAIDDYKKALSLICSFPDGLPHLFVRYLGLFRKPGSDRAMTGSRVVKVCTQFEKLLRDETIQWKGKRILKNRPEYWAEAMKILLEKDENGRIERPLENHNLLRCIAYDLAEKEFGASLKEKEERARSRPYVGASCARHDYSDHTPQITDEYFEKNKQKMQEFLKRLRGNK